MSGYAPAGVGKIDVCSVGHDTGFFRLDPNQTLMGSTRYKNPLQSLAREG
jgi:hypothetical protein